MYKSWSPPPPPTTTTTTPTPVIITWPSGLRPQVRKPLIERKIWTSSQFDQRPTNADWFLREVNWGWICYYKSCIIDLSWSGTNLSILHVHLYSQSDLCADPVLQRPVVESVWGERGQLRVHPVLHLQAEGPDAKDNLRYEGKMGSFLRSPDLRRIQI